MEAAEVRKLAAVEDRHWWYAERRHLLRRALRGLTPGRALDIGAAGGGNTRVLREGGWRPVALEYTAEGSQVAQERGLAVIRGDATKLPLDTDSMDLIVAFDVLEHIEDDLGAVEEVRRVLKASGTFLIAVPADPALWSAHDTAVGHVRRYTRSGLVDVLTRGGFEVEDIASWMVLLRPAVLLRRRGSTGSDLDDPHPVVNTVLRSVVVAERFLPTGRLPGVSLLVRARPR